MSTSARILIALSMWVAAPPAWAELAIVPRGPVYADQKGAPLKAPEGVACGSASVVVADTGNGRLVFFPWKDGTVGEGREVKLAQITNPTRVQIDSRGNVLVLDRKAKRIARLDEKGAFQGWVDPKGATGVVAGAFKLDASDNLYLLDLAGRSILVLDASGAVTKKISFGKGDVLFVDVPADGAGTVYAIEALGGSVWSAPKGAAELKPLSKSLKEMMSFPGYIAVDARGTIYVVDQNGSGLVLLGIDGSYLGRRLAIGWSEGGVYYPAQLCLTAGGEMVLADRGNNRVQLFSITR